MQKQPLVIFSTDWHLKKENIDQIIDLVIQQCELAKSLGVHYIACLGDILDSRIAQRQDVLTAFGEILDFVDSYGLEFWAIPGNHDKTIYESSDSFLDPYNGRRNFRLIEMYGSLPFPEHKLFLEFLPFFSEEEYTKQFHEFYEYIGFKNNSQSDGKHILCTHIAVTGSRNNDGTMISSVLSSGMFKDFFKVFSGHYHDQQKIGANFHHLPSIQQNNFGENAEKGFTVLYSDGNHSLVKSKFKEFIQIKIDLDEITTDEIESLRRKYKNSDDNIRFEFKGSETLLKSLRKEDFTSLGISVQTKNREIEDDILYSESVEVVEHTASSIKEEFSKFCEKEKLSVEQGLKFLNKKI